MQRIQGEYEVELHWKTGEVDRGVVFATSRSDAAAAFANQCGYGRGALGALDYWVAAKKEEN